MTPSPREVRDALVWWHSGSERISPKITDQGIDAVATIVVTAQAFVDERPICENCEGSGRWFEELQLQMIECPSCNGRGWVLDEERLEAAARKRQAQWEAEVEDPYSWDELTESERQWWVDDAEETILAYLEKP